MNRLVRAVGAAAVALSCTATPALAAADSDTATVTIDLKAKVAERCGINAVGGRANSPARVDQAQTVTFNFNLDCNTGFRIGVRAGHGALRLLGAPQGASQLDGFRIERPYKVALNLATNDEGNVSAGECRSQDLTSAAGDCPFVGRPRDRMGFSPGKDAIAIDRAGSITVTWPGEGDGRRLVAGSYQDTLTVEVGPRT